MQLNLEPEQVAILQSLVEVELDELVDMKDHAKRQDEIEELTSSITDLTIIKEAIDKTLKEQG